ncbi:MAG: PKD domain-containing protein [Bacteroidales bacterium]|nr:PKD domain-containing protein [Bacteroidales bacterium]MCK9498014.1 PKD domain-containing protein [Bacteroidales bacterium]MDY0314218.1 PKD domain-containing protein [Bacteroidales bacterium]NLB85476.1 PKD domain-containing protein [Bacteroidales bacterium]
MRNYYEIEGFPTKILIKPDRAVIWDDDEEFNINSTGGLQEIGVNRNACPADWPIADFSGEPLLLPVNTGVIYSDLSQNHIITWLWEFENGTPNNFNGQNPPEIIYEVPGYHKVKLTVANEFGNSNEIVKTKYVHVYELADDLPTAWFSANQVIVIAGNYVNFTDLSWDFPFQWKWEFPGGLPQNSIAQHPQNIIYNLPGEYDVQLIVRNSEGYDTLLIENYIKVIPEVGPDAPVANFTTSNRLVKRNTPVVFQDLSTNNPMFWSWSFQGGEPSSSSSQLQPNGIIYPNTGFFDVSLNVGNVNGSAMLTKKDYVVVYDSFVGKVCDTIGNFKSGEEPVALKINGMTGYYGGQNSDKISMYADYYDFHTFNQIKGIILPVMKLSYGSDNSYIRFITWDGADPKPTTVLSSQKVFLRDLRQNYFQVIMFDEPLDVDGPFYLGYSINYAAGDQFVVGMAPNRGHGNFNSLFVYKDGNWYSSPEAYEISTSTGIRPMTCLVGIEDDYIESGLAVYPNPCNDNLFISNSMSFDNGDFVEIFDKTGKTIKIQFAEIGSEVIEINTCEIASGMYYARIFTKGKIKTEKISIIK